MKNISLCLIFFLFSACSQPDSSGANGGLPGGTTADRKVLSEQECSNLGGRIMGDPGDGRIHRPNYICPGGKSPLGTVEYETGEMIPVEGSVCCPR